MKFILYWLNKNLRFVGQLCVMQEICISDAEALSKLLPGEPCLPEGCNCQADGDCPGENGRYVWLLLEFMSDLNDTFTILLQISMVRSYFILLCLYRCVACKCQECAQSPKGSEIFNPPLTFVIDTTKSVKPDKDSIFNLTQKGTFFLKQILQPNWYTKKFIQVI